MNINSNTINNGFNRTLIPYGLVHYASSGKKDDFSKIKTISNPSAKTYVPYINSYHPRLILKTYTNPDYIDSLVQTNPNIKTLLKSKGIDYKIYPENISSIADTHLKTTTAYALQIANAMNLSPAEKKLLELASIFHDFGKILIPKEIIEKPGKLTPDERKKIDLHAQLGYELLSQTGMNKKVLEIIKNHHTPYTQNNDTLSNVLSVADIYSALREQRSYKRPLSVDESFEILDQKAKQGEVSTEVVNALKSIIKSYAA